MHGIHDSNDQVRLAATNALLNLLEAIASADLPMWMLQELMAITSNVTNAGSSVELKLATLEAISYICQNIVSL